MVPNSWMRLCEWREGTEDEQPSASLHPMNHTDNRSSPPRTRRTTPAMVLFPLLVILSFLPGRCCDAASLLPPAYAFDVAVVANEPSLHCMYDFWQRRRPPCCYCAALPFRHHRFLLLLLLMAMKMIATQLCTIDDERTILRCTRQGRTHRRREEI